MCALFGVFNSKKDGKKPLFRILASLKVEIRRGEKALPVPLAQRRAKFEASCSPV